MAESSYEHRINRNTAPSDHYRVTVPLKTLTRREIHYIYTDKSKFKLRFKFEFDAILAGYRTFLGFLHDLLECSFVAKTFVSQAVFKPLSGQLCNTGYRMCSYPLNGRKKAPLSGRICRIGLYDGLLTAQRLGNSLGC